MGMVARDHPQREKACAMAPVTSLRAWALAAIEGNDNGAHIGLIAVDGDPALRIDFHPAQRAVRAATVILGSAGDAGAGDDPTLLPACFLLGSLLPDRVVLDLVQNLRRAEGNAVCVS